MITSLISGLLNTFGLDWMGFSPLTACINLYVFLCGVLTLFLEYKDHPATRDVKNMIRAQVIHVSYALCTFILSPFALSVVTHCCSLIYILHCCLSSITNIVSLLSFTVVFSRSALWSCLFLCVRRLIIGFQR